MQAPAPPVAQPHPRPTSGRRKPPSTLQPSSKQAPAIASHTVFTIKFPAPRVKRQPATKRSVVARSSAERRSNLRRRRGQRARTDHALSLRAAPQSAEATWGGGAGQPSVEHPPSVCGKSTVTHPTPDCHVGAPPPRNDTRPRRAPTPRRPCEKRRRNAPCLCEKLLRAPKQSGEVAGPASAYRPRAVFASSSAERRSNLGRWGGP